MFLPNFVATYINKALGVLKTTVLFTVTLG